MLVPASMQVESAVDSLGKLSPAIKDDEIGEFENAIGADVASKLGLKYPLTDEVIVGYLLGLETARVVVATSPALILKGVDPFGVL